jgi:phage repressor protein C with HTH and peptisase S24 domain
MGNNLKNLREARGWTLDEAAAAFGMSRGGYIKAERSERGMKVDRIERAAEIYGVAPQDVFSTSRELHVVGVVGAGEEIYAADDEAMGGGEPIDAPPNIGANAVAVSVRGDSMYPELDEDDVLVYDERYEADFDRFIGRRLVVGLPDGRRFVKRLVRGSDRGLYTLRSSNPRIRDIEDVAVEWVAPIAWIKPKW